MPKPNLNEQLAWLRKERGITLDELAAKLNELLKVKADSKLYQTSDKVFTYERKAKPVKPKFEVVQAYCTLFDITAQELSSTPLSEIDLYERWKDKPFVVGEPVEVYGADFQKEMREAVARIETKLDELLNRGK